jgi:hypothetical protein
MIKHTLLVSLISSSCSLYTLAQAPPTRSGPSNNTTIQRTPEQTKSPYGNEIPVVDPTNKTINVNGKTYSIADNHLGGQFEAYLATNTLSSGAATEYRANIRQILDYLAPNKTGGGKLKPAYDLLTTAAEYPGDGNICESLANSIYAALLTKQHRGSKREYAEKLRKERKRITRNMGVISSKLSLKQNKEGGPPKPTGQNSIE